MKTKNTSALWKYNSIFIVLFSFKWNNKIPPVHSILWCLFAIYTLSTNGQKSFREKIVNPDHRIDHKPLKLNGLELI